MNANTFKRYEIKFMLTLDQRDVLMDQLAPHVHPDPFGNSTICNVYWDTADHLLVRRSMEKPVYKEKLRVRSYGTAERGVYVELKKKYRDVVYKRRVLMGEREARRYLLGEGAPHPCQITREIDYVRALYPTLAPKTYIAYQREGYYGNEDDAFRVTFDRHILFRNDDLSLQCGAYGAPLLPPDLCLMEIKVGHALPLWLSHFLSEQHLYKTSFSKYGSAYKATRAHALCEGAAPC